ncbi:MAG: uroporphyrinogen-III synthase [Sphingomicrobium sp.]
MRRVLVLRPEPGATVTADRARQRGLNAVALALFKVEPLPWEVHDATAFDALLLTSANAVRQGGAGLARLRHLPVHAVGNATTEAARDAGFRVASTGTGGVDALLASLELNLRLLHLCGEHRTARTDAPQEVTSVIVYRSREIAAPDMSIAQNAVALVHSPRAAQRFAELIDRAGVDRGAIAIVGISAAAVHAAGAGWEAVGAAGAPNDDALLALAERLCNKRRP